MRIAAPQPLTADEAKAAAAAEGLELVLPARNKTDFKDVSKNGGKYRAEDHGEWQVAPPRQLRDARRGGPVLREACKYALRIVFSVMRICAWLRLTSAKCLVGAKEYRL